MSFELGQLWNVMSDKITVWVSLETINNVAGHRARAYLLGLGVRVEDAKVRTRVHSSARTPLPPTVIRGKIPINQILHKIL